MYKALKYRIYPDKAQKELIAKHIDSARFVYNLALETKNAAYLAKKVNLSPFEIMKQLPDLKKECTWLKKVNSQSLQQSIHNMDIAFKRFFKGSGFPKFKKKTNTGSFSIPQNIVVENDLLKIPKFKKGIPIKLHRPIVGEIRSATVSVTSTGKYFVSILIEDGLATPDKYVIKESTSVGIDLGIKDFAITSEGEVFANPKFLKASLKKLKYIQRKYSKYKGKRTRQKLALQHEKVANQRKDFLHKLSSKLISENQTICLEDLAVKNMMQNHSLAQAIGDVSWSSFVSMLEYKAAWNGNNILRIGRFAPSSKTCSKCGSINKELTLSQREWTCNSCLTTHDRDVNAAINIKTFALKSIVSGTDTKNQEELPTLVGAMTPEARPIAFGVGG